jgi:hypothetical protein
MGRMERGEEERREEMIQLLSPISVSLQSTSPPTERRKEEEREEEEAAKESQRRLMDFKKKGFMRLQHFADSASSPISITGDLREKILSSLSSSFFQRMCMETTGKAQFTALMFLCSLQTANDNGTGLTPLETDILLFPTSLVRHPHTEGVRVMRGDVTQFMGAAFSFLELPQLFLPPESAALQAAGCLPVNPVPSWFSNIQWKNLFSLATLCPCFRLCVVDLDARSHLVFSIIHHFLYPPPSWRSGMMNILKNTGVSSRWLDHQGAVGSGGEEKKRIVRKKEVGAQKASFINIVGKLSSVCRKSDGIRNGKKPQSHPNRNRDGVG